MNTCKGIALIFMFSLAVSFSVTAESAFAQTLTKPSVPEFSVKYVDHSYDKPATYTTDPYTGRQVQNGGGHVDNKTIDITIKNQQFTKKIGDVTLYYTVQYKGHFAQDWQTLQIGGYHPINFLLLETSTPQSDSQYTVISIRPDFSENAQVDYRVQALIAHNGSMLVHEHPLALDDPGYWEPALVTDVTSDWSSTQTVTISNPQNPSSPTVPELPNTIVVLVFVSAMLLAAVAVCLIRKKPSNPLPRTF
jgi:hypothetical protein